MQSSCDLSSTPMKHSPICPWLILLMIQSLPVWSDEGMWLFNDPPRQLLRERHQFDPSAEWLEHLQLSSVRFNSGGSGSLVSEDGLILSNHHVGADALHKFGDATHDYLRDGFYARRPEEEKRCLDLELNVLMSIENVTDRVNAAVKPGLSAEEAFAARRAVMAAIEKESLERTGWRSDVVTLYHGGQYHLYRYKKYTDVRLVFAPEQQIAFFGGDPDNFEYPRFNLDICLFRAYENGKPAKIRHYLKWSAGGPRENELVFVSGNPGRTSRLLTVSELTDLRDRQFPYVLSRLHRLEVLLSAYSARSEENARRAKDLLFGVENGRKAREGMFACLQDPRFIEAKKTAEQQSRNALRAQPEFRDHASAWDQIDAAQQIIAREGLRHALLESGHGFNSTLFGIARTLLRGAEEKNKSNGERLREYRDSNRESLEFELFSEEPLYDDLETLKLADSLSWLSSQLGADHSLVRQVLNGISPRERAFELVRQTRVKDVAFRRQLWQGDAAAVSAARDPMIELARLADEQARSVRKTLETQEEIKRQAYGRIVQARFALEKGQFYPDATFTLRLAFGAVKGYTQEKQSIPFQTTFQGLFERSNEHQGKPPFDLPPRWLAKKSSIDLTTPFNFVSTADIIGGNSGSPVVNRQGEFVGIIFDGNIQSLVLDFAYTDQQARAVSVHSQAILHALRKVYEATPLADELESGRAAWTAQGR